MAELSLLLICGSLRKASQNRKLLAEAARHFGPADTETSQLGLPLYDGDIEVNQGIPDMVHDLAGQIARADAVIIASPEYNQSFSGVLKNALDWVSRLPDNPWQDKPVAVITAAAGRAGGARSQYALRLAMVPFRAEVIAGPEVLVAGAAQAFDEASQLIDDRYTKALRTLMENLRSRAERG